MTEPGELFLGLARPPFRRAAVVAEIRKLAGDSNSVQIDFDARVSEREFYRRLQDKGISVMPGHDLPEPEDYSVRIHVGGKPVFLERMIETIESW